MQGQAIATSSVMASAAFEGSTGVAKTAQQPRNAMDNLYPLVSSSNVTSDWSAFVSFTSNQTIHEIFGTF